MFIRRTQVGSNAAGKHHFTYRLVRSERIGGKVKQITLLNLGRYFPISSEFWPALCDRVEELLAGQASLLDPSLPKEAAMEAEHIAAQLLSRQAPTGTASTTTTATRKPVSTTQPPQGEEPADIQAIDVNSLELVRPRSIAVEYVALWAMQQVGFVDLLSQMGLTGPMRAAVLGSIVGRMAAPSSEAATHRWLGKHSGLGELLDVDFEHMPPITLYRASDALMKHRDIIERTLFNRLHELLGFGTTVTLYDLTNTYFEGTAMANPKAKRGRSKEKRSDCPLVTLGLVLDGSGFVRVCHGNCGYDEGRPLGIGFRERVSNHFMLLR